MAIIDQVRRSSIHAIDWEPDRWDSLYVSLVPLPAAFMVANLASDLLYCGTGGAFWSHASECLLALALATGAFAAADGLIRYIASGGIRPSRICWTHVVGNVLALLLSLSNLVYRLNEDRAQAVVPAGIALTAIAMCVLLLTARLNRDVATDDAADDLELEPIWDDEVIPLQPADEPGAAPAECYPVLSEVVAPARTAAEADAVLSEVVAPAGAADAISTVAPGSDPTRAEDAAPTWPVGDTSAAPPESDTIWGVGTPAQWPLVEIGAAWSESDPIRDENTAPALATGAASAEPATKSARPRSSSPSRPRKRRLESPTIAPPPATRPAKPAKKRRAARTRSADPCSSQ